MEAVKNLELGDFDTENLEEQQGPHPSAIRENFDLSSTVPISNSLQKQTSNTGNRRSEYGFVGLENQFRKKKQNNNNFKKKLNKKTQTCNMLS